MDSAGSVFILTCWLVNVFILRMVSVHECPNVYNGKKVHVLPLTVIDIFWTTLMLFVRLRNERTKG
jgi:hypothetical protein